MAIPGIETWAGKEPATKDSTKAFFNRLIEEYPDIGEPLSLVEEALDDEDKEALRAALDELFDYMTQTMNTAYPKLSKAERKRASTYIGEEVGAGKYPRRQAIAIGLRRAAPAKYKKYERSKGKSKG